jgi:hypothetical protein
MLQLDQGLGLTLLKVAVHGIPVLPVQPPSRLSASVSIKKMPTALAMHAGTRHDQFASHAVTVASSKPNTHG